ncbi:MAG: serine/threonine-protein kinase, partial [Planctomycetota bacterium]
MVDSEENRKGMCPSPKRLRDWLDDRVELSKEENRHLSECGDCQVLLDALSTSQELQVWAEVGAKGQAAQFQDEPEFRALDIEAAYASAQPFTDATQVAKAASTDAGSAGGGQQAEESCFQLSPSELQRRLPGERYQIQKILASGGAGVVYLGYDQQLSREVAIKILTRDSMRDRRRFQREAKVLAEIQHPNIVRIFDMGTLDESDAAGQQYLVMEYVSGGSLSGMQQFQDDYKRIAKQMSEAALGVHEVHQHNLIHRDLKPSNLLMDENGNLVKVADFGLARSIADGSTLVTRTGDIVGTPEYMSPEQVGGEDAFSVLTDVYGLGATLYNLLTGEPLFQGNPAAILRQVSDAAPVAPRILNPEIPIDLETICLKAIEKEPANRFASAQVLADDLLRFSEGRPIEARPVSTWTKGVRFLRSNPALGSALSISFLLGAILVIGSVTAAVIFQRQSNDLAEAVEAAEASTRKAETALKTSVEAASELLVSVTRDAELLPRTPGSQEVSRKLLERARGYFESFLETNQDNPQLKFELARAHSGMAEIAGQLGNPDQVHTASKAALRLLEELPERNSKTQLGALLLRADTLLNYGNFQYEAGEADLAIDLYQKTIQACQAGLNLAGESNASLDSEALEFRHWMALAYRGMADAEILNGKVEKTYSYLAEARKLFDGLLESDVPNNMHRQDAAAVDMTLATTAIDRGENEKAKEHLAKALELLRSIPEDEPGALRAKERIGVVYTNIGLAERRLGNSEAAIDAYDFAIAQHQQLIDLEPSVSGHRWNLIVASLNSGGPMMDQGKMEPLVARWKSLVPVL